MHAYLSILSPSVVQCSLIDYSYTGNSTRTPLLRMSRDHVYTRVSLYDSLMVSGDHVFIDLLVVNTHMGHV